MREISEVEELIEQTIREGETVKKSVDSAVMNGHEKAEKNARKVFNKVIKRLDYYKMVKSYLKTGPTKVFIQNEYDRVTNRMSMIGLNFSQDAQSQNATVIKKARTAYEKEHGIPKLREQQKCLKFILGK